MNELDTSLHVVLAMMIQAEKNLPSRDSVRQNLEQHFLDLLEVHAMQARMSVEVKKNLHTFYNQV